MIDALDIGYAIKDRRSQLGLTQAQVAEMSGVSKRCLWSLELGQNPGVRLNKLAAVFDVLGIELVIADSDPSDAPAREAAAPLPSESAPLDGAIDALAVLTGASK